MPPHGFEHPRAYLNPTALPQASLHTLNKLAESESVLISVKYPTEVQHNANEKAIQIKLTKLIHARHDYVGEQNYDFITGTVPDNQKVRLRQIIKKRVQNTRLERIGAGSWVQGHIIGDIAWYDSQVLLNNYNRAPKILAIPERNESPTDMVARLALQREYETALDKHVKNISNMVNGGLEGIEDNIEEAACKHRDAKAIALRKQHDALLPYKGGLHPTDSTGFQRVEDAGPEDLFYGQMGASSRKASWETRWSPDVLVSWLWEFSDILHFKQNWSDIMVNHMFRDRYVYLAGEVFNNTPKIPTSNSPGAAVPFLNTSVLTSRLHSEIYAAFGNANEVLWPSSAANVPGDHMTLWVEANSDTALHRQKRSRPSSSDEAYVAAIKRRRT